MESMEKLIRVGITGQEGFMGTHLYNFLGTKKEYTEIIEYDISYFNQPDKLSLFVSKCDVVVHIAAMNRHEDEQVIYNTNIKLVEQLIDACQSASVQPKIIFTSSTQEDRDNLYGKSKKDGRKLLEQWASKNNGSITSFIIPNVFGPFGRPFYNSFIATFCQQIVQGESPTIINDSVVNLIYINKLCEFFFTEIMNLKEEIKIFNVPHSSSKKVSEILELLKGYKADYFDQGVIPNIQLNSFELDLFNTFTSFIPKDYFPRKFVQHADNRGAFVEIIRANTAGQSSFSTTVPGITRGNHYHTRKVERFAVIKGKAIIKLRKIDSDQVHEFKLDGEHPAYVDMPIWFTHNITNIGDTELITMFWINEPYDSSDPDTFFVEV